LESEKGCAVAVAMPQAFLSSTFLSNYKYLRVPSILKQVIIYYINIVGRIHCISLATIEFQLSEHGYCRERSWRLTKGTVQAKNYGIAGIFA
jgi:hypothetical protein